MHSKRECIRINLLTVFRIGMCPFNAGAQMVWSQCQSSVPRAHLPEPEVVVFCRTVRNICDGFPFRVLALCPPFPLVALNSMHISACSTYAQWQYVFKDCFLNYKASWTCLASNPSEVGSVCHSQGKTALFSSFSLDGCTLVSEWQNCYEGSS